MAKSLMLFGFSFRFKKPIMLQSFIKKWFCQRNCCKKIHDYGTRKADKKIRTFWALTQRESTYCVFSGRTEDIMPAFLGLDKNDLSTIHYFSLSSIPVNATHFIINPRINMIMPTVRLMSGGYVLSVRFSQ